MEATLLWQSLSFHRRQFSIPFWLVRSCNTRRFHWHLRYNSTSVVQIIVNNTSYLGLLIKNLVINTNLLFCCSRYFILEARHGEQINDTIFHNVEYKILAEGMFRKLISVANDTMNSNITC